MSEERSLGTYGEGGFSDKSTFSMVRMFGSGSLQKVRGLSPGTGNASSKGTMGDCSDSRRIDLPVTAMGAKRRARTVVVVEMSFMVAEAFRMALVDRCWEEVGGETAVLEGLRFIASNDSYARVITGYLVDFPSGC